MSLTKGNIITILKYTNQNISEIDNANYSTIQSSDCNELKRYIDKKIDFYISDVLLKLPNNDSENEDKYLDLLNNSNISSKNIIALVNKIETKISDISLVTGAGISEILIGALKVKQYGVIYTYIFKQMKRK